MLFRIFLALILLSLRAFAQVTPVIDSLQNLLDAEKNETRQIELYNLLAGEYKSIDPYQTREYANKAYELSSRTNNKRGQADALHKRGLSYYYLDSYDTAIKCYQQSFQLAKSAGDSMLVAQTYLAIGNVFRLQGLNDTALTYLNRALKLYEQAGDEKNIAFCVSTIGDTYLFAGDFEKALSCHKRALDISLRLGDVHRVAFCYSGIGNNYHMRGDFDSSIYWHTKSIEMATIAKEENIVAGSMGVIADGYANLFNYPKAIETYLAALDLAEKKQDKHNTAFIYAGMSDIYQRELDYVNAEKYLRMSITVSNEIGDLSRSCNSELTMAQLYLLKGDTMLARKTTDIALQTAMENNYPIHQAWGFRLKGMLKEKEGKHDEAITLYRNSLALSIELEDQKEQAETRKVLAGALFKTGLTDEAITEATKALALADTIGSTGIRMEAADILSQAYESKGDFRNALSYSRLVKTLSDSLNDAGNAKRQAELFAEYQNEKNKAIQDQLDAETAAQIQLQKFLLIAAGIGLVLLVILAFFIFRGSQQKQRANEIISLQKKMVEEKNQEITDSIHYAKNIQLAMLPAADLIEGLFSEHFVFFRPRDIVSGDFYWVGHRNGKKYFAVSDCTGHGVPGGFMSMLGLTLLNEILDEKNITSPEKMLNELRTLVIQSLNKDRKAGTQFTRDGMDISLIAIDPLTNVLEFSGANNGIYILRGEEFHELEPDKQPVGAYENQVSFTLKQFTLEAGDVVIAYSDGYPDQFGGVKGKKLMYRQFRQIITNTVAISNDRRVKYLGDEFDRWKSGHAQIDDVCVFGVKI